MDPDGEPAQSDCPADSRKTTIKQPDVQDKLFRQHRLREVIPEIFAGPLDEITLYKIHTGHPELRDDL